MGRKWRWVATVFSVLTVLVVTVASCYRYVSKRHGEADERAEQASLRPVALPAADSAKPSANGMRIVLDRTTLARLRDNASRETPAWKRLAARCDSRAESKVPAGYQAWEWADAVASLSLCWHATDSEEYARAAVGYLEALIDDRASVGDRKGGASVVPHDSGYGIRTYGAYTALGSDWLRSAPGMSGALRERAAERLGEWLHWYSSEGYLSDQPFANYYWGYLTTLTFAGLAFAGERPAGDAWLSASKRELSERVLPSFDRHGGGGHWPEGWQYGDYVATEMALVARGYQTALGVPLAKKLPWLGETVALHTHALLPDRRSIYDGGTWAEHPARPSALAMNAVSIALDGIQSPVAAEARWLVEHALPPMVRQQMWVAALAEAPQGPKRDPRSGEPLQYSARGTGLSFMRSDWSSSAVWASFQAGPRLTPDHQHKDQGHFELWRGSDGLIVDGGHTEGGATINHNTLLVDDEGRVLTYSPNQGVWGGDRVRTTAFGAEGDVVSVSGDIAEAYAPACVRDGCSDRAISRLVRTLVYVRPNVLVVHDDVELVDEKADVVWAAHVTRQPSLARGRTSAVVGESRVDIHTIAPEGAPIAAPREPTTTEGGHRKNQPWGPMWRIEVKSPAGDAEREFFHWIVANAANAPVQAPRPIAANGMAGAIGNAGARRTAVLVLSSDESARADRVVADRVIVAGLTPGKSYSATFGKGCALDVRLAPEGRRANAGGALLLGPCRVEDRAE